MTGASRFTADLKLPGLAHARVLLSPHASAAIAGIELEAARKAPGVIAIITGSDLGWLRAQGPDAPLACGRVFFTGQPVVAVVAETEAMAADAIALVEVEYTPQPAAVSIDQALADGAPRVLASSDHGPDDAAAHGAVVVAGQLQVEGNANVTASVAFSAGDLQQALADADFVVEGSFESPSVHQGFLEPHIAAARYDDDGTFTIWSPTQGIFPTRNGVAEALGVPVSQVRVLQAEVGGGFGAKVLLLEPLVAILAKLSRRTVQLSLTRSEEFLMGRGAPLFRIDIKLAAGRDGRMTGLWARVTCDNGAGRGGLGGLAATMLAATYRIPNYDVATLEVATHKTPVAAYRAPGANQAYFALESAVDELARKLDMDPITFRLINASVEGDPRPGGLTWPRIAFKDCLEAARRHPLYSEPLGPGEALGVAAGAWLGGLEPAAADCRVESDGTVLLQTGHSDISGTNTTLAMIVGELLGIPIARVRIRSGDTEISPYAGMAGGSKTVYTVGLAVQEAVLEVRDQLLAIASEEMEVGVDDLELAEGHVYVRGVPGRGLAIGHLAGLATQFGGRYRPVTGKGRSAQTVQSPMFTVQLAKVVVDAETGEWRLLKVAAIQDVGKALNPAEIEGQVHGGALQAMGRALGEELVWDSDGNLRTVTFLDYGLPSIELAASDFSVELVEVPSPHGPFGAKGVGEPPAIPGSAVIANAIRGAAGRRLERLPFHFAEVSGLTR